MFPRHYPGAQPGYRGQPSASSEVFHRLVKPHLSSIPEEGLGRTQGAVKWRVARMWTGTRRAGGRPGSHGCRPCAPVIPSEHHPLHPKGAAAPQSRGGRPAPEPGESPLTVPPSPGPSCPALCLTLTPSQPAVSARRRLSSETCLSMCLPPPPHLTLSLTPPGWWPRMEPRPPPAQTGHWE